MSSPFTTAQTAYAPGEAPATDSQVSYVESLIATRDLSTLTGKTAERVQVVSKAIAAAASYLNGERGATLNRHLARPFTKRGASNLIELLKDLPEAAQTAPVPAEDYPAAEIVPAGCYALETVGTAVNGTVFYKVDRPETGKWAGHVFVKRLEGDQEIRVRRDQVGGILARIASVGALEASQAYGRLIGECGVCHATLTNDESRAYGVGPVCRKKF